MEACCWDGRTGIWFRHLRGTEFVVGGYLVCFDGRNCVLASSYSEFYHSGYEY